MARSVARQQGQAIRHFTTAVFDLAPLPDTWRELQPGKDDPWYYYRPWKTLPPHFRPVLCRWLTRLLPRLQEDVVDDIWADTLLAVLKAARKRRFRRECSLWPWMCRIAYTRAVDFIRRRSAVLQLRQRLQKRLQRQQGQQRIGRPSSPAASAEDIVSLSMSFLPRLQGQQKEILRVVLEQLPKRYQTGFLQQHLHQQLGRTVTRGAIKFALHAGRRKLAGYLQGHGYDLPEHLR
jgi:DNA-directed RNA polymerase specialized sigma24 family protein